MIEIIISDTFFQYDAYHMTKAFYPNEIIQSKIRASAVHENGEDMGIKQPISTVNPQVLSFWQDNVEKFSISEEFSGKLPEKSMKHEQERKACKHRVNMALYERLMELTGKTLDWGILMGVRPTKMAMKKWKELGGIHSQAAEEETKEWLQEYCNVSPTKSRLAMGIARREEEVMQNLDLEEGYSLYIGIPFCKTRCSYCSFTAYPLHEWEGRMDEYLDALCKELEFVGEVSGEKGGKRNLNTIYMGGGTPTSLTAEQLDRVLACIEVNFSYEHLQEITVEAGRPDSITKEKLEVMRKHKVGRISINPQTMQEKTLKVIGREHSVADIYRVYEEARSLGFETINMDLIVGLPGETVADVEDTLEQIAKLEPDNLTVHSLAMKRTSKMTLSGERVQEEHHMGEMIELAAKYAEKMELKPYYLYRQKNMAGNYENVGYAKVDKVGIYNILIMEERQSIVAVGAGASTKIVLPREKNNILRIENVKDVNEYITRIDEMIARKGEVLWH